MTNLYKHLHLFIFIFFVQFIQAQGFQSHLSFKTDVEPLDNNEFNVKIICTLDKDWHVYSQHTAEGGPLPTQFVFTPNKDIKLIGKVQEIGKLEKKFDELFGVEVSSFAKQVTFLQKVKVNNLKTKLEGEFDGQVCKDEEGCMPFGPEQFSFSFDNQTNTAVVPSETNTDTAQNIAAPETNTPTTTVSPSGKFDWQYAENSCSIAKEKRDKSIFLIFFFGFLGGLVALLTPCVFPMVPLTVSFFTKGGQDKKQGLRKAFIYGTSIVVIYVLLGLIITSLFGSDALNAMSTDVWFNMAFFVIFIVFAFSFFGFYEITLPSSWANRSDSLASKGGNLGIFFMAFTLALVSFSCTGPIIGTLLVEAATGGGPTILGRIPIKPAVGMLGFSTALALPFTLFALFPQWLHSLPKSGGWMNTVKITLGFIELALAFKFLSIADMTQNWGLLRIEPCLVIWIILFFALALYLLGIIKSAKDDKTNKISVPRRILGLAALAFSIYMGYGLMTYKPLKLLSGLAPPVSYNFRKDKSEAFIHFKDYDEGLAYAKAHNMPLLIDFTGYGCVNCRKVEEHVWTNPAIAALLSKYVVVSLYVDDRKALPEEKWYTSTATGKERQVKTIGQKWSDFQALHFKTNSQPYYVLIDKNEKILNQPVDYAFSSVAENYESFLKCGLNMSGELNDR
jgi:thiol:disulfide interchange protein DsbD